jgi:hypothetical protein
VKRLHHTTHRRHCETIAREGFRDSHRMVSGVYLAPPGRLWSCGGFEDLGDDCDFSGLGPSLVVYAFDVPDDVAAQFAVYERKSEFGHLDAGLADGADLDDIPVDVNDGTFELYEYCVPAEIANRFCVGIVHGAAAQCEPAR